MSYGLALRAASLFSFAALTGTLAACSAPQAEDTDGTTAASTASTVDPDPRLSFNADFTSTASGPLVAGQKLHISYDTARNTSCRGDLNGHPGWSVTGFARVAGGPVTTF